MSSVHVKDVVSACNADNRKDWDVINMVTPLNSYIFDSLVTMEYKYNNEDLSLKDDCSNLQDWLDSITPKPERPDTIIFDIPAQTYTNSKLIDDIQLIFPVCDDNDRYSFIKRIALVAKDIVIYEWDYHRLTILNKLQSSNYLDMQKQLDKYNTIIHLHADVYRNISKDCNLELHVHLNEQVDDMSLQIKSKWIWQNSPIFKNTIYYEIAPIQKLSPNYRRLSIDYRQTDYVDDIIICATKNQILFPINKISMFVEETCIFSYTGAYILDQMNERGEISKELIYVIRLHDMYNFSKLAGVSIHIESDIKEPVDLIIISRVMKYIINE
jgi:hypothetical protein